MSSRPPATDMTFSHNIKTTSSTLLITLLMLGGAAAQNAENKGEATSPTILASRLVGPDIMKDHLQTISSNCVMAKRTTDPFGQLQDPNAAPKVVKTPTRSQKRFASAKPTAFSEIIGKIKVNTIMPSENRFLIGTRSFSKGDRFPIEFRGRPIQVEIIKVTGTQIDFANTQTGEVASVKLKMLPPGMSAGNDGISTPGMVPNQKDAPLQIDSNSGF